MRLNTYTICSSIASRLASKVMGEVEANELQKYSLDNFEKLSEIYNQIARDKNKYATPYVAISTVGESRKVGLEVEIDIEFAIPQDQIVEVVADGVISYQNREKLSEFAEIIMNIVEKENCTGIDVSEMVFIPNDITEDDEEYSGKILVVYRNIIPISKFS